MNQQELNAHREVLSNVHDVYDLKRDLRAGKVEVVEAWINLMEFLASGPAPMCDTFGCVHEADQRGSADEPYFMCFFHHQKDLKNAREDRYGEEEEITWDDMTDEEREAYHDSRHSVPPVGSRYHGNPDADEF